MDWEDEYEMEFRETPDGVVIASSERRTVDGEEWFPVMGMAGDEWVRTVNKRTNGNPHILQAWGEEYGMPRQYMPDDWDGPEDGEWVAGIPYTFRGFDFTEHDVDFSEPFPTFEEAVREGKRLAEQHAPSRP